MAVTQEHEKLEHRKNLARRNLYLRADLKTEMDDAQIVKVGDAAGELRSESPNLFVVLDAIWRDAILQLLHDELSDSED